MDACQFPRCRRESAMSYIGRQLCETHWQARYSDAEDQAERLTHEDRFLAAIGLQRTESGEVLEANE